jgi:PHP family Zn ribbon phosphoesterase
VQKFKADLHIHTVLSPCADLEMSPKNIVKAAKQKGLSIIGITDHNSTLQCPMIQKIAADSGILVLAGAEVTSREEVHNLVFFETDDKRLLFQEFIERKQMKIRNNASKMGYQVLVDENDQILREIDYYLGMALNAGIDEIEEAVHSLDGFYIPAHINRTRFGLISQLGFVPEGINADALEIFNRTNILEFLQVNNQLADFTFLKDSDAHYIDNVGSFSSTFLMEQPTFAEIRKALKKEDGRKVEID